MRHVSKGVDGERKSLPQGSLVNHADNFVRLTHDHPLPTIARRPQLTQFVDSAELALILGEPHLTVHRHLTGLMADGILGRASHGTVHLPSGGGTT